MSAQQAGERLSESNRVEAFSDGVLAIALTLLVLDLHAPDVGPGGFGRALADQWPSYVAYLAAFLNISAIWLSHHDLFTRVRRVNTPLMGANLVLLLVASLFPFPAAVISAAMRGGDRSDQISADLLYALIGFLIPIAWIILYGYLGRSPQLLTDSGAVSYMRQGQRRSLVSLVVYPIAAALSFIDPLVSLVAFAALPMFFIGVLVRAPSFPGTAPDDLK
jgi:uncharacterized membrane protein